MNRRYSKRKTRRFTGKYDTLRKSQSRFCTKECYASEIEILQGEHVY